MSCKSLLVAQRASNDPHGGTGGVLGIRMSGADSGMASSPKMAVEVFCSCSGLPFSRSRYSTVLLCGTIQNFMIELMLCLDQKRLDLVIMCRFVCNTLNALSTSFLAASCSFEKHSCFLVIGCVKD